MFSATLRSGIVIAAVASLKLVLGDGSTAQAFYDQIASEPLLSVHHLSFNFVPPEDSGQPQTNRAGGRRDQFCGSSGLTQPPTLLVPPTSYGITTAERPTVLVYLPQTPAQQAFLKLEDEHNDYLYYTTVTLPERAGIVQFTVPDTLPALDPEADYKISLAIMCDEVLDPNDPVLEGWIKRVEPDAEFVAQHTQGTDLEMAALYASNGVWFDALAILANLRQSQANDPEVLAAWEELLQSVGLEGIQEAELLSDLQPELDPGE